MLPILATKIHIPPSRPRVILRPRLEARLNEGLRRRLTLVSAPAGFGKTTLVAEWSRIKAEGSWMKDESKGSGSHPSSFIPHPSRLAWLSLDEGDNDPTRFLAYFVAALQTLAPGQEEGIAQSGDPKSNADEGLAPSDAGAQVPMVGAGVMRALSSPQPPPIEALLTDLLNEIAAIPDPFFLVLDDYHVIDAKPIEHAVSFLLEHMPPRMHLVIATREDPSLPLARLRARDQLIELRAADLRFTLPEATAFLNQVMGLTLAEQDVAALESRTEGWIAGLQLAALAIQGQLAAPESPGAGDFIQSFTGSHHFVMDYMLEQVLQQQPEPIQTFLLYTSILDRLCGPLCDAVLSPPPTSTLAASGQETLESLERANLFIVPLDNERRWYRYHHLFADLLRQRLKQRLEQTRVSAVEGDAGGVEDLHLRASRWYQDNGFDLDAFRHAAAANDVERAERLIDGKGIPLHFRGGVTPILEWLDSLPAAVKNARPSLWYRQGSLLLINGQTVGVAEKLQAAEDAIPAILHGAELGPSPSAGLRINSVEGLALSGVSRSSAVEGTDAATRTLLGQIAAARATLALTHYDAATMLVQSHRALEFLSPHSPVTRASAYWTMGYAHILQGERVAARQAFEQSLSLSRSSGAVFTLILAALGLGQVQEADNDLVAAAETYRQVLQLAGDQPQQIIGEAHVGLGRILYEWNDPDAAEEHARKALVLAHQYEQRIDRFVYGELLLSRVKLARGDVNGAASLLAQTSRSAREQNFVYRIPEVAAVQVVTYLRMGDIAAAAQLAQTHNLPLSRARVHLAQGDPAAALAVLEPRRREVEQKGWADERLKVIVLQAVAHHARRARERALDLLGEALVLAEPGGFIRLLLDEGLPMAQLLSQAAARGMNPDYTGKLLAVLHAEEQQQPPSPHLSPVTQPLIEPLSQRELEILRLIARGLANREICDRLYLALNTVKGYNQKIFGKLHVARRTEAVARARELGLL